MDRKSLAGLLTLGLLASGRTPLFSDTNAMPAPGIRKDLVLANRLMKRGEYSEAMDYLTGVLIRDPGNGIAREQIYQISQLMTANAAVYEQILPRPLAENERSEAVELAYQSLRKTSPQLLERRLQDAARCEKKKFYLLACQNYLSMLSQPGLELETKYRIERRLRSSSQKVDAKIQALREDARAVYREAFTLMNLGDWDSSVDEWRKYADMRPSDAEVRKLLTIPESVTVIRFKDRLSGGYAALEAGQSDKAASLFEEALRSNPNSVEAEKGLEQARKKADDLKKSKKVMQLLATAEDFLHRGKKTLAVQVLSQALKENPNDERALAMIQSVMESAGSVKTVIVTRPAPAPRAVASLPAEALGQLASAEDSGKAETHYQKGLVYYSLRNYREAFNEFKLAVRYDPNSRKLTQALQRVQSDLQFEDKK